MKIFIYCRVSKSNGKYGTGANINNQIDDCYNYCIERGLSDGSNIVLCDHSITGRKSDNRKNNSSDLTKLLNVMNKGDIFVIHSVDRLSRNLLDGVQFLENLTRKGCRIVSITDGITYDDLYGKFSFRNRLNHAEFESDKASDRSIRSIKNRKKTIKKTISSTKFQCRPYSSKRNRSDSHDDDNDVPVAKKKKKENNNLVSKTLKRYSSNTAN
jgi:DNA invertase Pin-like site-specific DNA recombinase